MERLINCIESLEDKRDNGTITMTEESILNDLIELAFDKLNNKTQNNMKLLRSELQELGFTNYFKILNGYGMDCENVRYEYDDLNDKARVYVLSVIDDDSYHRQVKGLSEGNYIIELVKLCKIING